MGEQWILRDVVLGALPLHHVGRIVQHALDEHAAGLGHDDRRGRLLAEKDRQAADVIQVAVGDDDQIQRHAPQRAEVGRGRTTDHLRMQSAIDENLEIAELNVAGIGADAAVAVEVE